MAITVCLPDGNVQQLPDGATGLDLARSLGPGVLQAALAVKVDARLRNLGMPLPDQAAVAVITARDPDGLALVRHAAAHLLARAVKRLFPDVRVGIGPVLDDGFHCDFQVDRNFGLDDLATIEAEMHRLAEEGTLADPDAGIPSRDWIPGYPQGTCHDLCLAPHLPESAKPRAFKLLSTSVAQGRDDGPGVRLCRILGTAFTSPEDLAEHLGRVEAAKARDHRKLGRELDLFSFHGEAPASPFFHPKGTVVYNELVQYIRSLYQRHGYCEVITPGILDVGLWKTSGHHEHYSDKMYFTTQDDRALACKPMNCPCHCLMYGKERRSYRDLPIRYADFGRLHRCEPSGATQGLTRVRSFCQDDAHIFCTAEQVKAEIAACLEFNRMVYRTFGFDDVRLELSTRPRTRLGTDDLWDQAEAALAGALDEARLAYQVNPGDGAFYGPKIDFHVRDALNRPWQLATLQVDHSMPSRFGLVYAKADGTEAVPTMLHRASLGSIERFMGILIEHCGGAFSTWLAPVQVAILPLTDRTLAYARSLQARAVESGIRAEVDSRNETVNARIRAAQLAKVPYMLVVGDREAASGTVSVRHRQHGDLGAQAPDAFLDRILEEIRTRA